MFYLILSLKKKKTILKILNLQKIIYFKQNNNKYLNLKQYFKINLVLFLL